MLDPLCSQAGIPTNLKKVYGSMDESYKDKQGVFVKH